MSNTSLPQVNTETAAELGLNAEEFEQIKDILGRVISTQTIKVESGLNRQTILMNSLSPAMYTVTIGNKHQKTIKRITKI